MLTAGKSVQLIIAEDDEDDFILVKSAFERAGLRNQLVWVKNGEELLNHLRDTVHVGPRLVILDLNMPRMDGREALGHIKADPALRLTPIIIMTTSSAEEDVMRSYEQGVNSFIRKPVAFDAFVAAASVFKQYWLDLVELPDAGGVPWTKE